MINSTMKKVLTLVSLTVLSGCAYSSDALFPSLFGSDTQEERAVSGNQLSEEVNLPVGTSNFEPVAIAEGNNTGTFVGQKVMTFRGELSQLQTAIRNSNAQLQQIRGSVINNALQYHKVIGMIEAKLQVGTTPGNPQMFAMLQGAQNNIQVMNANTNALSQLAAALPPTQPMPLFCWTQSAPLIISPALLMKTTVSCGFWKMKPIRLLF